MFKEHASALKALPFSVQLNLLQASLWAVEMIWKASATHICNFWTPPLPTFRGHIFNSFLFNNSTTANASTCKLMVKIMEYSIPFKTSLNLWGLNNNSFKHINYKIVI